MPRSHLDDAIAQLRKLRELTEMALQQVPEERWFTRLDGESNSLAFIMKHMAGNVRSRWTDFLTTDGEKPDRRSGAEFEDEAGDTAQTIRRRWDAWWALVFEALAPLDDGDLGRTVVIRGEPHTVVQAVNRQITHYALHVGQILFLAKHLAGGTWRSPSVPRGMSERFNETMRQGAGRPAPRTKGAS